MARIKFTRIFLSPCFLHLWFKKENDRDFCSPWIKTFSRHRKSLSSHPRLYLGLWQFWHFTKSKHVQYHHQQSKTLTHLSTLNDNSCSGRIKMFWCHCQKNQLCSEVKSPQFTVTILRGLAMESKFIPPTQQMVETLLLHSFVLFCLYVFCYFLKWRYDWHLISYILECSCEFITTSRILPQEHKEEF